jgi:quinohemoprotein ethanol dehydrogenase
MFREVDHRRMFLQGEEISMPRTHRWILLALLIGTLSIPATMAQQSRAEDRHYGAIRDWPMASGDLGNQRYSTLTQIDVQTVKRLGGAWMSSKFDDSAASRATPVVKDGLLFITAGTRVYAFNAKTGKTVWNYNTAQGQGPQDSTTTSALIDAWKLGYGLPNAQGVAVGDEKVFVGLTDGRLIALGEHTGEVVWSKQLGDDPPKAGQSVSASPSYFNGVVYVGLANGDYHIRGRMVAIDAKNGQELWHFFTVPGPGETGHDSWPKNNNVWRVGGAGVWQSVGVDPDLGLVFFVGGNPVPQYAGESRAGDNLFCSTVVALDMKTGKLRWYYQLVHHDIWDADIATPLILYDAEINGRPRKALAALRPDGYLFMFDRETGKPLIPIQERPVPQSAYQKTAATQPFPVGADSLLPECSYWKDKVIPGFELGCTYQPYSMGPPSSDPPNILATGFTVRFTPMAYSQQSRYFYALGIATLGWRHRADDEYYFGQFNHVPGLQNSAFGLIGAFDSKTSKIAWKKEIPMSIYTKIAPLTTAGGLMFHPWGDGNFQAYDAKTGEVLWQFQTGFGGGIGGAATSYEIDGEQYVALSAGPAVWAFKLDGAVKPLPAPDLPAPNTEMFTGLIEDVDQVDTATLNRVTLWKGGPRYHLDEYGFNPYRTRVKVGTKVTWVNNGKLSHTIMAQDGSWTTGSLTPSEEGSVTFDKPGTYVYICKDHPWSYGQIIVVADNSQNGVYTQEQARRGRSAFNQNCSTCHMEDLAGRGVAPALVGDTFSLHWGGVATGDLLNRIRTTMPQTNPGSLSPQAYLDILAFMLQSNGLLAGTQELKADSTTLKNLVKDLRPK